MDMGNCSAGFIFNVVLMVQGSKNWLDEEERDNDGTADRVCFSCSFEQLFLSSALSIKMP